MNTLTHESCLQLANDVTALLSRGEDYVRQNDTRALSYCLQALDRYGDSLVRIIWNLTAESELRNLLIQLYTHLLEFVLAYEAMAVSEEMRAEMPTNEHPVQLHSGGRPSFHIDMEKVRSYRNAGLSWSKIAEILQVSRKTVYRKCKEEDIDLTITDPELKDIITVLKEEDPSCGERYVSGELRARGYRVSRNKVREVLRIVDPAGTVRRLRNVTARRKKYSVKGPNYVWHIDGNEKLQPYRMYIHAAVDGYSRKVMYLKVAANKKAETVGHFFKAAVQNFGFPKRARSDKGRENTEVASLMFQYRGVTGGSFITGKSVHNVRVERLWREVNRITYRFKLLFQNLDELGLLNLDSEEQMFYLHYLFLPQIQKSLHRFQQRWNMHKIRTANNQTPNAMYMHVPRAPLVSSDLPALAVAVADASQMLEMHSNVQIWHARAVQLFPNPLDFDEYSAVYNYNVLCGN